MNILIIMIFIYKYKLLYHPRARGLYESKKTGRFEEKKNVNFQGNISVQQ